MSSRPSDYKLTAPGSMRLYSTSELMKMPPPSWLVPGHIPQNAVIVVFGEPGGGKTFVVLDLSLSVASPSTPWQGIPIAHGDVVYVAAEGGFGIPQRVRAWCAVNNVDPAKLKIAWMLESVLVNDDSGEQLDRLIERIDETGAVPKVIILDTLARTFVGDENQQQDMGAYVAGADRLRNEYGCTVIIVHHTNLSGARERGNTALRGAADAMIRVKTEDGVISVTNDKQKDAPEFPPLALELKVLGLSAAVVKATNGNRADLILEWLAVGPLTHAELKKRAGAMVEVADRMSLATLNRHLKSLRSEGKIIKNDKLYELAES